MLYAASDIFKCALDTIIHYGTEKYKSVFGNDEAAGIKDVMETYGKTKEQFERLANGYAIMRKVDSRLMKLNISKHIRKLPMSLMVYMTGKSRCELSLYIFIVVSMLVLTNLLIQCLQFCIV